MLNIQKWLESANFEVDLSSPRAKQITEVDAHHEKHAFIIADMNHYLTKSHHMGEILSNFRQLVNKWVINHIMEEDQKIGIYLKGQNTE